MNLLLLVDVVVLLSHPLHEVAEGEFVEVVDRRGLDGLGPEQVEPDPLGRILTGDCKY